jgi:hypothetical protein
MIIRYPILFFLSSICIDVYGGIFKCANDKGEITFQQRPCDKSSKTSEQLNIETTNKSGPVELNSKNKKLYKLAHYSDSIRVTAIECKKRTSSYSEEVQQASDRLFEIRKSEVEAGNEVLQRGFPGLPPNEIASLRSEGKRKLLAKFSKMSRKELNKFCGSQARKARSIAAMTTNRSSGYMEGDIDPEGND